MHLSQPYASTLLPKKQGLSHAPFIFMSFAFLLEQIFFWSETKQNIHTMIYYQQYVVTSIILRNGCMSLLSHSATTKSVCSTMQVGSSR